MFFVPTASEVWDIGNSRILLVIKKDNSYPLYSCYLPLPCAAVDFGHFPFSVDPFSEGTWQTGTHKSCHPIIQNGRKCTIFILSP